MSKVYLFKDGQILKYGHTMFLEDAVKDLNYYHDKHTAGQKTLSPEVRDLLDIVKESIQAGDTYILECCANSIEKLLGADK